MPPIAARATAVVGALLVSVGMAVGLAGCSPDEPTPIASLTAPATPRVTPSEAPTPTPAMPSPVASPTLPVEWQDDGEAGAEEAARYFLRLYVYTVSTQDTSTWKSISHPECGFCQNVIDSIDKDAADGRVTLPAPMEVGYSSVARSADGFIVTLGVSTGPDEVRSTTGELIETTPAAQGMSYFDVVRVDDRWILRGVQTKKGE